MKLELLFGLCLALAFYAYAGYPLLAMLLASRRAAPAGSLAPAPLPALTVLLAARDEAPRIVARLRNLLASDYPADRIEVVLVDDGSRDGTAEAARSLGDRRVRVLQLPQGRGKAAALNAGMKAITSPLTVFADARQSFTRGTLAALVAPMADPGVGVVSGEVRTLPEGGDAHAVAADGSYARIERALRRAEARLGWAHAASGAVYALRTELFRPLPEGLLLDDVYTPLQALRAGSRIEAAPDAIALDVAGCDLRHEFRRKLRTLVGNWQLITAEPWLLSPWHNPVFVAFFSHKLVRLLAPWSLLGALLASALSQEPLLRIAFWLQLVAYGVAGAALFAPALARRIPLASVAGSFVTLNAAAFLSLPLFIAGADGRRLWKT